MIGLCFNSIKLNMIVGRADDSLKTANMTDICCDFISLNLIVGIFYGLCKIKRSCGAPTTIRRCLIPTMD